MIFSHIESTGGIVDSASPAISFAPAVIIAPISEELLFRAWLCDAGLILYSGFGFCTVFVIILISNGASAISSGDTFIIGTLVIMFGVFGILHNSKEVRRTASAEVWLVGCISAVMFGFAHLINFSAIETEIWIFPGLVLSQIVGGLFYMAVRLELGVLQAVILHSLFNLELYLMQGVVGEARLTEYIFSDSFDNAKRIFIVLLMIRGSLAMKDVLKCFLCTGKI